MKKKILFILPFLLSGLLFSQENSDKSGSTKKYKSNIPAYIQYSKEFEIQKIYFNKRIDTEGRGEFLEVEMVLKNNTEKPINFYVVVVASYEVKKASKSSFARPIPNHKIIKNFVPSHGSKDNFKYPLYDSKGNIIKDNQGNQKFQLLKFPKNPKVGIDEETGKPYNLREKLIIRTYHLSPYRVNYTYFNRAVILIFNEEGSAIYRQMYDLDHWRR